MEDAKEILTGTAEEIKAKIGDLPADALAMLEEVEQSAKSPRKTVAEALAAERSARESDANEALKLAQETAEKAGIKLAVGDEVTALENRVASLEDKLNAATQPKKTTAPKGPGKERAVKLDPKAEQVPCGVAFADADGRTSKVLRDLEFRPAQFSQAKPGAPLMLEADIEFPQSTTPFDVSRVFVLNAKGKAFGECRMIQPLRVGGGTSARFPRGYLAFNLIERPTK